MREGRGKLETVREKDIDLVLLEEFHVSPLFQEWFFDLVVGEDGTFENAWRSVTRFNGESDLEVAYTKSTGKRHLVLIENKITADEQPDQARRYKERGEKYRQQTPVDEFLTVLIAPQSYIRDDHRRKYDAALPYEQILEWFTEQEGARSAFKERVFDEAIALSEKRYIKSTDEETDAFWQYYESLTSQFPALEFSVDHEPASGTTWFRFNPTTLDEEATIVHKANRGVVDLMLRDRGQVLGELRRALEGRLDEDMHITRTGRSAAVRIAVPSFTDLGDPESKRPAIKAGLAAAGRLQDFERRHRDLWNAVEPSSD